MKPLKVLFVHGGILNRAGTEKFMLNVLRTANPNLVHIDFLVFGRQQGACDLEVLEMGSRIYTIPYQFKDLFRKGDSISKTLKYIKLEGYDIVHSHMNALDGIVLWVMEHLGIKLRLSHSHSSAHLTHFGIVMNVFRTMIPHFATACLACSKKAGDFLYGAHHYTLIHNGIDTTQYCYNPVMRAFVRQEYHLEDKFVIGHVGRFSSEKNHLFLIDIFASLKKRRPDAHLVCVGEGHLRKAVQAKVQALGLENDVTFTGELDSSAPLYQSFDVFVLPSQFEGLPYVLVEAQCAGLPCIVSDTVSSEAKLTEILSFCPLDSIQPWVDQILKCEPMKRKSQDHKLIELGYNNNNEIINFYQRLVRMR